MHTFNGKETIIHYDSDVATGKVIIRNKHYDLELSVSGEDIIDFVAEYVREEKIGKLEQMNSKEVLGLEWWHDMEKWRYVPWRMGGDGIRIITWKRIKSITEYYVIIIPEGTISTNWTYQIDMK